MKRVRFIDEKLFKAYQKLKTKNFEEQRLAENLDAAIAELKKNPLCGIKIPHELWPKEYVKKYHIDNLRKYNLPDGWRLIYTLVGNEIEIISVLLEWLDHKNYEKRFGYKNK
jgi:Txe/YoeB family toxin of Txe-Axe toxin-antitoxin module